MRKDSMQINTLNKPQNYRLDGQTWQVSKKEVSCEFKKVNDVSRYIQNQIKSISDLCLGELNFVQLINGSIEGPDEKRFHANGYLQQIPNITGWMVKTWQESEKEVSSEFKNLTMSAASYKIRLIDFWFLFRQGLLNLDGRNSQKYLHQTKADFLTLIMLHNLTQTL